MENAINDTHIRRTAFTQIVIRYSLSKERETGLAPRFPVLPYLNA
jgi:hypothetical protein